MRLTTLAAACAASLLPATLPAQVMASEHAVVSQTVDGTVITVQYFRPQRRGRSHLFGGVVPWGQPWTPGANWATTIEVTRDVRVDGHPLPRGRYSLWTIPQPGEWTVILSSAWKRFHVEGPDPAAPQVRFTVKPDSAPVLDVLTFTFPAVAPDGTTLQMHWGTMLLDLRFTVPPSNPSTAPATRADSAGRR